MESLPEFPDYKTIELIHAGQRNLILKVAHKKTKKIYTIKAPIQTVTNVETVIRYVNEYETGKQIHHDNILHYKQIINTEGKIAIVREYFEGVRLIEAMPLEGYDTETFLYIAIQLVSGLEAIHKAGIIHKDIKPSNIIINNKNVLKIIDFGLSSFINDNIENESFKGNFEGSLNYISPEQTGRLNTAIDYRTDFYSLGVSFYQLLTGNLPFHAENKLQAIHQHIALNPNFLNDEKPEIPEIISKIVFKLMEKNPAKRYFSTQGLKFDLQHCIDILKDAGGHEKLKKANFEIGKTDFSEQFVIPKKLYGRRDEEELLHNTFNEIKNEKYHFVTISGEAGLGKTSLIKDFAKTLQLQSEFFVSGKFSQVNQNIAYSALKQAFRTLVKTVITNDFGRSNRWSFFIQETLQGNEKVIAEIVPEIEIFTGKLKDITKLNSNETKQRFHLAFSQFLSVFYKMNRSLVIFIDDLQWADIHSIDLLKYLCNQKLKGILFIFAFRNNELQQNETALNFIFELSKFSNTTNIILQPIKIQDINLLLSDTLTQQTYLTLPLAGIIQQQTNGNPYYVKSLITNLYQKNFFTFDQQKGWTWRSDAYAEIATTENAVNLLISKISDFSAQSLEIIKYMAILGYRFTMNEITAIAKFRFEVVSQTLLSCVKFGLLNRENDIFSFTHYKVLEAVNSLITKDQRQIIHLTVGQSLLRIYADNQKYDKLFDILMHYNKGIGCISSEEELSILLDLNVAAIQKAKDLAAYNIAYYYAITAKNLLPQNSWSVNYYTTLQLFNELVSLSSIDQIADNPEFYYKTLEENVKTPEDKVFACFEICAFYINTGNYEISNKISINLLSELGLMIPTENNKILKLLSIKKQNVEYELNKHTEESLKNIPLSTDVKHKNILNLLLVAWNSAFYYHENLMHLCTLLTIEQSLIYGLTATSAFGFANYGAYLTLNGNYKRGYFFAQTALELSEIIVDEVIRGKVYNNSGILVTHFGNTYIENLAIYQKAFEYNLKTRNSTFMNWALMAETWSRFLMGQELDDVLKINKTHSSFINNSRETIVILTMQFQRALIQCFTGYSSNPLTLNSQNFDTETWLEIIDKERFYIVKHWYFGFLTMLHFIHNDFLSAYQFGQKAEATKNYNGGSFWGYEFKIYYILSTAQLYYGADTMRRKVLKIKFDELFQLIQQWNEANEAVFGAWFSLILAEKANIEYNPFLAIDYYDKAISQATKYNYLHITAIASDLANSFWVRFNKPHLGKHYLNEAIKYFKRWGATVKVSLLNTKYNADSVVETSNKRQLIDDSFSASSVYSSLAHLDFYSVHKATQSLSIEIETDKILESLMYIILENAGAQNGAIILKNNEQYQVVARIDTKSKMKVEKLQLNYADCNFVSPEIIGKVIHSEEAAILADASKDSIFSSTKYVVENQVHSIYATPLTFKKEIIGVVYLENNLIPGIFTKERIEILNIIIQQAAISLINAQLFKKQIEAGEEIKLSHSIMQQLPDSIILTNDNGVIERWLGGATKMFGYEQFEMIGKNITALQAYRKEGYSNTTFSDNIYNVNIQEVLCETKNGKIFPAEIVTKKVEKKSSFIHIYKDISEQKIIQKRIKDNEDFLKIIFNKNPFGIFVVDISQETEPIFTMVSPLCNKYWELNFDILPGKTFREAEKLLPYFWFLTLQKQIQKCVSEKIEIETEISVLNNLNQTKHYLLKVIPLMQGNLIQQFVVGNLIDVTERIDAQILLKQSEKRLQNALLVTTNGFWDWDLITGNVFYSQQWCEALGYQPQEVTATVNFWQNLIHEEDIAKTLHQLQLHFSGKTEIYEIENRMRTKSGVYRYNHDKGMVVERNHNNVPLRIVGTSTDISQRKLTEIELKEKNDELIAAEEIVRATNEELQVTNNTLTFTNEKLREARKKAEESDRLKSAFLANMSHEIRTPMNGIVGFASLLDNDDLSALDKRRYIKLINISIKQLLTIINDIIDISKIESEQLPLHKVVCNVNLILEDLKIFFESSDERQIKSGIQIITEFGLNETESTIETDDVRLNQILTNLIGNALKFTNKGFIKIGYRYTLKNEKPYLEFYVEDTGKGIAQDKLNIIFDRFRQEDESHTRKFGGTGLGLAICRGLLQLLDGEIWVTSMEGKGSTFYFTIPYTPANKKTVNIPASKNISTNYFWKNKIILVVEDVDIVFEYINEIIEATGAKCIHTKDGQSAVNICLNNNEIDLVLMDIQLPVMNGYDASKIISEKKPNLPIIAQTAYALTGDREKTLTSGCVDYISKPIKKDVLLNTIQKYIFKKSEKNETDF